MRAPLTGRKQLNILPESQMIQMSFASYTEFMKSNKLSNDRSAATMVTSVGKDIAAAVQKYFSEINSPTGLMATSGNSILWKITTPNAWCLPGGKVVVYDGILPLTQDNNGLAVVLSHEIAHAWPDMEMKG